MTAQPTFIGVAEPILFSHDIFSAQTTGGISRAMIELATALTLNGSDNLIWAGHHRSALLQAVDQPPPYVVATEYHQTAGRLSLVVRNEPAFARLVASHRRPIVHRSYYAVLDLVGRGKHVETLHDLWDERSGTRRSFGQIARSRLKRRALERADAIVCVSQSTLDELNAHWPDLAGRAVVIPHGVRRLSATPFFASDTPYFLFVGQRGHYKNFAVALAALQAAGLPDHGLICFGGGPLTADEQAVIARAGLAGRIHQTGGGDDDLAGAYEGATALLYPSSYEGFGLPLLEAMVHHCPVIAAPLTSLPEVGGNAAVYAVPERPEEWGNAMARIANDSDYARDLRERGMDRADGFTWSATARLHADLYRQLA